MLESISIKDFAVIKELNTDLKPGLNIFTGETGAGKSVIIEAISMALGSRADTSYVRNGCEKAVVSLQVDTDNCDISSILEEFGIPNDNPMVIRREISNQSKSICRINGAMVPLSALSALCKKIADIHGQYDQQILLDPDNHIGILDLFGGNKIKETKDIVAGFYEKYAEASTELYKLKKSLGDSEKQRDFLSFQLKEIQDAKLYVGEDDELEAGIKLMENSENLYNALSNAYSSIYSSDQSVDSLLSNALNGLEHVSGISNEIDNLTKRISETYYELEDVCSSLREQRDSLSFSQRDLDDAIERLQLVNSLKRKYGGSIEKALEYAFEAEYSLNNIENADDRIKELEKAIFASKADYDNAAAKLTESRHTVAKELEKQIDKELSELNFNNARFGVSFGTINSSINGNDSVEFLISANLGEDLKPLAKVASGGELSRIMLALKGVIGDLDGIPTMIFDEIDTGISGATAAVVGDKLCSIAEKHQVICITHLPQIASKGSNHFKITKHENESSVMTDLVYLDKHSRVEELARLLSGAEITDSARKQAVELLGKDYE